MSLIDDYLKYKYHNHKECKSQFSNEMITNEEYDDNFMLIEIFGFKEAEKINKRKDESKSN